MVEVKRKDKVRCEICTTTNKKKEQAERKERKHISHSTQEIEFE